MVSYFTEKWFPAVCSDIVTMSLFSTLNDLSVSFNVFSLFTSKASRTFFYTCLTLWRLFSSESSWIVHGTLWCVQWCRMTPSYLLCCLVDVQCNVSIPFSLIPQYICHCMNNPSGTLHDDYYVVASVCFDIGCFVSFCQMWKYCLRLPF